ncbi:MAG: hypothetical protein PHE38_14360 [Alishewanella agri]|nr:hypothetical protein [Alishewanella agri]
MSNIRRAWINQPSKLQPLNHLNGVSVLVVDTGEEVVDGYFLEGDVISMRIPRNCLSIGHFKPKGTPLGGLAVKNPEFCRCETYPPLNKDCGCAFGQCAKGLIF